MTKRSELRAKSGSHHAFAVRCLTASACAAVHNSRDHSKSWPSKPPRCCCWHSSSGGMQRPMHLILMLSRVTFDVCMVASNTCTEPQHKWRTRQGKGFNWFLAYLCYIFSYAFYSYMGLFNDKSHVLPCINIRALHNSIMNVRRNSLFLSWTCTASFWCVYCKDHIQHSDVHKKQFQVRGGIILTVPGNRSVKTAQRINAPTRSHMYVSQM